MPRFSEREKERIRERLLGEGERLFTANGLRKTTIDDLTEAVHIAKASFYTFYDSKESLYLDIVQRHQARIFSELETVLERNRSLPGRQRVRQVFTAMYGLMGQYPILAQIDEETMELITRKVPRERLTAFAGQNVDAVGVLERYGISFACSRETASLAFLAVYRGWTGLQGQRASVQAEVADILLGSVIDRIVAD